MKNHSYRIAALLLCAAPAAAFCATDNQLDEVVVTATRIAQPISQSLTHTSVITRQDILDSQAVDVPGVLKNLAGIEYYQSGGTGQQGSLVARLTGYQGSGNIFSLVQANALLIVPSGVKSLPASSEVEIWPIT